MTQFDASDFLQGSLWIRKQILIWGSCEQRGSRALQHNCNRARGNASWITFRETALVTSDPSDKRGERSEDVLLAGVMAYIHAGYWPESCGTFPAKV